MITYADQQLQRTPDWFRARLGCITGSQCADLLVKGRSKDEEFGKTAKSYLYKLAFERSIADDVLNDEESFQEYLDFVSVSSKAMRWGQDNEDHAIAAFEVVYNVSVQEVASCKHDTIPFFAASPDGMVFRDRQPVACVEVKCPEPTNFMLYSSEIHDAESLKAVNPTYYWQVVAEMVCTGVRKAFFVVYNPFHSRPLHVAEILLNDEDAQLLSERVILANQFIDNIIHHGQ